MARLQRDDETTPGAGNGLSPCGKARGGMLNLTMPKPMDQIVREYTRQGHPDVDELVASQGLVFPRDPRDLLGNFWPEEESINDFLKALRDWRGRKKTDPAA